ncbi:MAG: hypothetical protein WCY49_04205 [Anaerovoracaceae bacterium]
MKQKILITVLIMALIVPFVPSVSADEVSETRYHLDMGVWSIPEGNKSLLNSTQTYNVNLNFGSPIEVENVSWFKAGSYGSTFWDKATMNCVTGSDRRGQYDNVYDKYVTSNLTNLSTPVINGNNVSYSCKVKLQGQTETFNIGQEFAKRYADKVQVENDYKEVNVPVISAAKKKEYTDKMNDALKRSKDLKGEQARWALLDYNYYKSLVNDNRTVRVNAVVQRRYLLDSDLQAFKDIIY